MNLALKTPLRRLFQINPSIIHLSYNIQKHKHLITEAMTNKTNKKERPE